MRTCVCVCLGPLFFFSPLLDKKKKCRWLWNAVSCRVVSCRWWIHFAFLCVPWTIAQQKRFTDQRFAEQRQLNRFRYYFHSSALISRIKAPHKIYKESKWPFRCFFLFFSFFLLTLQYLFCFYSLILVGAFFCVFAVIYLSIHFSFGLFLERKNWIFDSHWLRPIATYSWKNKKHLNGERRITTNHWTKSR